jgi:putative component of membrane protein insertase Oxa1/YidC/SpoIIIJ protein YidD
MFGASCLIHPELTASRIASCSPTFVEGGDTTMTDQAQDSTTKAKWTIGIFVGLVAVLFVAAMLYR